MEFETILYERDDAIATITLNRPKALNAITPKMLAELEQVFGHIANDDAVRLAVLTGAGRAFSAGVDLKALGHRRLEGGCVGPILDEPARAVMEAIARLPKLVIAKVNGFCFTGALELALACDLIVVAEEAKLGDTHAKFGLRPTWGMSARLPALVGIARAKELSYTARTFTGIEAAEMGLANRAVPLAQLDETVRAWGGQILENSSDSLAAYKALYHQLATLQAVESEANRHFDIADTEQRIAAFRPTR